jgi:hypothetical protein
MLNVAVSNHMFLAQETSLENITTSRIGREYLPVMRYPGSIPRGVFM